MTGPDYNFPWIFILIALLAMIGAVWLIVELVMLIINHVKIV